MRFAVVDSGHADAVIARDVRRGANLRGNSISSPNIDLR